MHEQVTALAAGRRHSVCGRSDGSVRAVGNGAAGECGVLGWTDVIAVAAGNVHTATNTGKSHTATTVVNPRQSTLTSRMRCYYDALAVENPQ